MPIWQIAADTKTWLVIAHSDEFARRLVLDLSDPADRDNLAPHLASRCVGLSRPGETSRVVGEMI